MNTKIRKQRADYWLILAVFALMAFGLIMIYSVSKYYSLQITDQVTDKYYLKKQLTFTVLGLVVWFVFQNIDYRFWQKYVRYMLPATVVLLMMPVVMGGTHGRWVSIAGQQFQPSEIAKLTFVFYLAGWFASRKESLLEVKQMFWHFAIVVGLIAGILLIQKDLGTLSVFFFVATTLFIVAGSPVYQLGIGAGMSMFLVWLAVKLEPYRMERITAFLNPESSSLGSGYHIRNALIAIGSGGLFGLGFGQSRQKYLYLPEAHTDSIFAIISEELGFIRSVLLILAFALVAWRGFRVASKAPDTFSRLTATGITAWITMQAYVNIAAMLSLVPLTGIPMPFVSYGGSSLMILLAAFGVLINISKQAKQ